MGVTIRKDKRYRNRFIVDIKAYGRRKASSFHSRDEASAYARAAKKLLAKGKFQFEDDEEHDSGDMTVALERKSESSSSIFSPSFRERLQRENQRGRKLSDPARKLFDSLVF